MGKMGSTEQMTIDEQFKILNALGNDLQFFLEGSDEKRDKEQQALENAAEMMGEYFSEIGTDTDDFKLHLLEYGVV